MLKSIKITTLYETNDRFRLSKDTGLGFTIVIYVKYFKIICSSLWEYQCIYSKNNDAKFAMFANYLTEKSPLHMVPEKSLLTKSINTALSQKSNPCSDHLYIIVFEINVYIISRHILFRKRLLMDNHGKTSSST